MQDPSSASDPHSVDCAGALILRGGRILLGLRAPDRDTYPDVWDVFGGHVEGRETVEQALVRELGEELDITPTRFQLVARFWEPDPLKNGRRICHFFKVTSWLGPGPRLCGAEHTEIRWHTLEEALALNLAAPEYRALFQENIAD